MAQTFSSSIKFPKILSFIAVIFMLYILKPLILPLILAGIFAVMIFPIQKILEKKLRCSRLFATLCSIFITFIITMLLLFTIAIQLQVFVEDSNVYISKMNELYQNLVSTAEDSIIIDGEKLLIVQELNFGELIKNNFGKLSSFVAGWSNAITDIILVPIYMFFFLYYRKFLRNFAYRYFKNQSKIFLNKVIHNIYNVQRSYLIGLIKVILIVGTLNTIGLLILGINNAVFFGFFGATLITIPYVGVFIGSLLPALVALATKDSYLYAVGVISIFGFIQLVEGYFITPKIVGSGVNVNSFAVIIALLSFAMLWGILGMVVALPLTAALKVLFDYSENYKAIGFLLGDPEDKFITSAARVRLKKWQNIRKRKSA